MNIENIYNNLKQQYINLGQNIEDNQILQQAWSIRDRMLLEVVTTTSTSSSSSVGAGGGGRKRNIKPEPITDVLGQSYLVTWVDSTDDIWRIAVYNYDTNTLNGPILTNLINNNDNEWYLYESWKHIQNKGFVITFGNADTNKYKLFFISTLGHIIDTGDLDNNEDFQYSENVGIYLGNVDGKGTVYHYTGYSVNKHTFNITASDIEVDDAGYKDTTEDSTIIIEAPNNTNYFLGRPDGTLLDVTSVLHNSTYDADYTIDYIPSVNINNYNINILSQNGTLLNTLDTTSYGITYLDNSYVYGDKRTFFDFDTNTDKLTIVYDRNTNTFCSTSRQIYGLSPSNSFNTVFSYSKKDWFRPISSDGKTLTIASYIQIEDKYTKAIECENVSISWLPGDSNEFLTEDLSSLGTIALSFGNGYYESRTFTTGENPIIFYGATDSIMNVGFLTKNGMITESTGLSYSECTNILGHNIGEYTYALFDMGSERRVWQIYGSSSILHTFETTRFWEYGGNDNGSSINGTLAVVDTEEELNSFIFTSETGLTVGVTGIGLIRNDYGHGNRTGLSSGEQVIIKFKESYEANQYVDGFYILDVDGLSDYYKVPDNELFYYYGNAQVGKNVVTLLLSESNTYSTRILTFSKSTKACVNDIDTEGNGIIDITEDRCLWYTTSEGLSVAKFLSINGITTLNIQSGKLWYTMNDSKTSD